LRKRLHSNLSFLVGCVIASAQEQYR
jgi:hypothetical protein